MWLGLILLAAIVGLVWLLRDDAARARRLLDHALKSEAASDFEEACYYYAILAATRRPERGEWAEKVRSLWHEHGPFTFERIGANMRQTYCSRCESCGEGYHRGVVGDVKRILAAGEKATGR